MLTPTAPGTTPRSGGLSHARMPGGLEHDMAEKPELDDGPTLPLEEDTVEQQIDGEHPDGDYPQDIYDDDPDEPIEGEPADEEDEEAL